MTFSLQARSLAAHSRHCRRKRLRTSKLGGCAQSCAAFRHCSRQENMRVSAYLAALIYIFGGSSDRFFRPVTSPQRS